MVKLLSSNCSKQKFQDFSTIIFHSFIFGLKYETFRHQTLTETYKDIFSIEQFIFSRYIQQTKYQA